MLYNRTWANNYEELITYYPLFYRDVKEMDAILHAHGKLADDLEAGIEQVFANGFIDTMDEPTIERLEIFLEIGPNRSRALEERRRLVKSFFAGFGRVSASRLKGIIQSYTGAEAAARFEPFDDDGNNMLYLEFERGDAPTLYMGDINLLLSKKIPAHIKWQAAVVYPFPVGIGVRRTHYRFDYDLTGTKPDLAMLGVALALAAVVESRKTSALGDYDPASEDARAGQVPDIASIGSYLTIKDVIGAKAKIYTTELKKAQNGDLEAGVWPDEALLGRYHAAGSRTEAKKESHVGDYEATGTKPDPAQVGTEHLTGSVVESGEKSYPYSHEPAGVKPDPAQAVIAGEIDAGTGVKATDYSVDYIYCGTGYPQS